MKEDKKIIGIYKITNPEGHCYIGQSIDILKRLNNHKKGLNSNKLLKPINQEDLKFVF